MMAENNDSFAELFSKACRLRDLGQVAEALRVARDLIPQYPDEEKLHLFIAYTCEALGDQPGSVAALLHVLELRTRLGKDPRDTYRSLSLACSKMGDTSAAVTYGRKAAECNPGDAHYHSALVPLLMDDGQYEEALEEAQIAVRLDPETAVYYLNLAVAYNGLNRHGEAIQAYERLLHLSPDDLTARVDLARTLQETGQFEQAEQRWREVIERGLEQVGDPEYELAAPAENVGLAHIHLGQILHLRGKTEEAIAHYKRCIALEQEVEYCHLLKAVCLYDLGETGKAKDLLRIVLPDAIS